MSFMVESINIIIIIRGVLMIVGYIICIIENCSILEHYYLFIYLSITNVHINNLYLIIKHIVYENI